MDEEREKLIEEMVDQVKEAFKKSLIALNENPNDAEIYVIRNEEEKSL